jgi:protocatechuate 3,4-dioxygenase, beta subunit
MGDIRAVRKMEMSDTRPYRRFAAGTQPEYLYPSYISTIKRAPTKSLIPLPHTKTETTGPVFGHSLVTARDSDLTMQHEGEPLGERIIVSGRVLDEEGRPVSEALVELWQANAAGRYLHKVDQHGAPIDPNFSGCGRVITDAEGRYRFVTIKPGAYPWGNHHNGWRPQHIHFSLFGAGLLSRLVTQMYFPGDPLLEFDPIFNSIPDECARRRLISRFDWETTQPNHALGYRFDIVLRGREQTPVEK